MINRINKCIIGRKYQTETRELNDFGIITVSIPENTLLDEEINNHADILVFKYKNNLYIDSQIKGEIDNLLSDYNLIECNNIRSPYPFDCKLNNVIINNRLFGNTKNIFEEIIKEIQKDNIEIVHTNQGYTKCSLCILNDCAVITEDIKLSSLLKKCQIDVLTISKGFVHLSDKHYGFIGGASAKIADDAIYFSGDLSKHPDYCKITEFLNKYNIKPVFNTNRKLTDFGGIIPLF